MKQKQLFSIVLHFIIFFLLISPSIPTSSSIQQQNDENKTSYPGLKQHTTTSLLDTNYIYNLTENLSKIIWTEYNYSNGEIQRGRAFGTPGEWKAAEIIAENMTKLGLWTRKEPIANIEDTLPHVASKLEVLDYQVTLINRKTNTQNIISECYIAPTWKGPRNNPDKINHHFIHNNLDIIPIEDAKKQWYKEQKGTIENNYLFITVDHAFNPYDTVDPIQWLLCLFLSPYSDYVLFYNGVQTMIQLWNWYQFLPHCQGLIRYDFNNETYNMGNSVNWSLPTIFINGSTGKKIIRNTSNYGIDYSLKQRYNESVKSYNVIGQLNGTNADEIIIIDSLYDGWWCQATGDSAIGMSMVLGIAKYYTDRRIKPNCTLRFIGFGGEEHGYRGAKYYEAITQSEPITHVIDLNQLGFKQDWPKLSLDILCNNNTLLDDIWTIAQQTQYEDKPGDTNQLRRFYMPRGAPSNDLPFARNRDNCSTICFLKGVDWLNHHRDGGNHSKGDVIDYFDWDDVNATGDLIINITTYITNNHTPQSFHHHPSTINNIYPTNLIKNEINTITEIKKSIVVGCRP